MVTSWIYATLTKSLLNTILKTDSPANSVWVSLENLFRDNKDTQSIKIDNELQDINLGDQSIVDYCEKIIILSNLLADL